MILFLFVDDNALKFPRIQNHFVRLKAVLLSDSRINFKFLIFDSNTIVRVIISKVMQTSFIVEIKEIIKETVR